MREQLEKIKSQALADIHTEEFGLRSIRRALHRFLEAHAAGNL